MILKIQKPPDRSPEQKRIILTRLFSNLSINGPTLEVELSELAVAIADKVKIHQQLVKKFELTKNDLDNRGRGELTESLRTIWLGMRDSNPRCRNQNPMPYHLANPQYASCILPDC